MDVLWRGALILKGSIVMRLGALTLRRNGCDSAWCINTKRHHCDAAWCINTKKGMAVMWLSDTTNCCDQYFNTIFC